MLTVAACLWDANYRSQSFSRCYDETWAEKLYRGFKRNLTKPFRFVVFTERTREFDEPILQERLSAATPDYGCLIEPFKMEGPLIVCGLDMVVLRNVDHMALYCETAETIAAVRDPYREDRLINPVVLVPEGHTHIYRDWSGQNDMAHLRQYPWKAMDDLWPGQVVSLKAHRIRDVGPGDARIVYMHGDPKPHELLHLDWVKENWR